MNWVFGRDIHDVMSEAWATLSERTGRTLLASAASGLGIGVLMLTIGLTQTISRQVSDQFNALRSTEVVVVPIDSPFPIHIPLDAETRVSQLDGVVSVGLLRTLGPLGVSAKPAELGERLQSIEVVAATPQALIALQIELEAGRLFDEVHTTGDMRVAVVGIGAASRLGLGTVDGYKTVTISGVNHVVLGIASEIGRRPAFGGAIIVPTHPTQTESRGFPEELLIETEPGAAGVIAAQASLATSPNNPDSYSAIAPPDPTTLRQAIEGGLQSSLLTLGVAVLLVGSLSIANAAFVSVLERTREIGVRRALGATPAHIALQVVVEAAVVGLIGGIMGATGAVAGILFLSAQNGWSPTIASEILTLGPAVGIVVGALAGLIPARRAIRIEPSEALRV